MRVLFSLINAIQKLGLELDLDRDLFGHLDAHDLPHRPLVGLHVDQALVHAQLPPVPCRRSLTIGRFSRGHNYPARGEGDGPRVIDADPLRYSNELLADLVELFRVGA